MPAGPQGRIKDWAHPALESIMAAATPTEFDLDRPPANRAEYPSAQERENDEQESARAKERTDRTL